MNIAEMVAEALEEDIGAGDLTSSLFLSFSKEAVGNVVCREKAVLCGAEWFTETYAQLDNNVVIDWYYHDGDMLEEDSTVCKVSGSAVSILTGERTALNFLQMLSGTSTLTSKFVSEVKGTDTKILDTRKTIPLYREAQKYAVKTAGGQNHRMGLFDAVMIKENHIATAGSISAAVAKAKQEHPDIMCEVEVESFDELAEALLTDADVIMLDNFSIPDTKKAVKRAAGKKKLEASGNIDLSTLKQVAETGVDYISTGSLTKNVRAVDFSLRFESS